MSGARSARDHARATAGSPDPASDTLPAGSRYGSVSSREAPGRAGRYRVWLRAAAIALSAPCIFWGLLGAGSILIFWSLIEVDFLRLDFYLSLAAAAGPVAFLLWVERERREAAAASGALRACALALNVACIVLALAVAAVRGDLLGDATLAGMLALLVAGPALNVAVLLLAARRR